MGDGTGRRNARHHPAQETVKCLARTRGEDHASYVLYGRLKGKRFSIYVANDLVPEIWAAIDNGQRVQRTVE